MNSLIKNSKSALKPKVKFGISALKDTKLSKPINQTDYKTNMNLNYGFDSQKESSDLK